jgi:hypothetical protein
MTQPLDLDQIEARANAATPGPWEEYPEYGAHFYAYLRGPYLRGVGTLNFGDGEDAEADREFVKHAREDVAAMADEIRRLRAELATARANGIRYAAELVTQAFHGEPFLSYPPDFADLLREHADRLTAATSKAPAAAPAAARP